MFVCICAYMYVHVGGGRIEGEEVYKAMESERIGISERIYVECFEVICLQSVVLVSIITFKLSLLFKRKPYRI